VLIDYLKREDVLAELKTEAKYIQCNNKQFSRFLVEFQEDYTFLLPRILENTTVQVLVFNGQFDLRCGVLGTNEWLRFLPWSGRPSFNYAKQRVLYNEKNTTMGTFKSHKNLIQARMVLILIFRR
jgi:carboxypeptidase C (cathepsin A)